MKTAPQDVLVDISRFDAIFALSAAPDDLRDYLTLYEQSRGDAVAPTRADLDLRRLSKFLPDISILERKRPGEVIHRLMGTGLVERFGIDFTGQSVLPHLEKVEATRMELGVLATGEIPCCTFSIYENIFSTGRRVQSEALGLPLDRGDGKKPYLYLGFHRAVTTLGYEGENIERIINNKWITGLAIDLGYGVPDPSTMEKLTRKP